MHIDKYEDAIMNKGELRNVLVTGGWTTLDDFAGGLTMEGGTAVNCTLAGSTNSAKDQRYRQR